MGAATVHNVAIDAALFHDEKGLGGKTCLRVLLTPEPGEAVSVDVAGPEMSRDEFEQRALNAAGAVVDHHGDISEIARDHGLIVGYPLRSREVSALHADDYTRKLSGLFAGKLAVHVVEVVL